MKEFLKNNALFFSLWILTFILLGIAMCVIPKAELHLQMNACHNYVFDVFFKSFTIIAEYGLFVLVFILLFIKVGPTIYLTVCGLSSTIIVQIIKHIVNAPRPKLFFESIGSFDMLPIVEGVNMHNHHSFPSGHTTTFFVIFGGLSVILTYWLCKNNKNNWAYFLQFICFGLAVLGAYSRIYLSQHFAADVFAGSCIAMVCLIAWYPLFGWLAQKHNRLFNYKIPIGKQK
ncbi:MAG: phosphatase PAP2 family protein [Bacteroidales bacterium]|nr:phosphatase PAP2 family protein [Bacteroidales bacterium]